MPLVGPSTRHNSYHEKVNEDPIIIREVLDEIVNYVEKKCPFNFYQLENSDCSDDPDYIPPEDNTEFGNKMPVFKENSATRKRKITLKIKEGRKRVRNENVWKDRKAQKELNLGNEHENRQGKLIPARAMKAPCKENCRNNCRQKISEEKRKLIFHDFWKLGNHTRQWDFIARCVLQVMKKQVINKTDSRRNFSRDYKFFVDNNEIKICKTMFLNTLGISETWITTALNKIGESGNLEEDRRGRHTVRPQKIINDVKESIRTHIKLFPLVPSHYIRKNSSKMYLEEGLNIMKMYRMYKENFKTNSFEETSFATERQYREVLNSEFNISFFKPKKDQCVLCTAYTDADVEAKSNLQEKYDKHLANKQAARSLKDKNKDLAIDDKTVCAACFDLQKVLVTPQSEVSTFFYKSKIATYNFTVYDMGNNQGYCYVWYEEIAKRGPNEISSCLLDFLKQQKDKGVKTVFLYSDNCGGQNRNRFIFSMFAYAANILKIQITHRFLEKGHTQNEGDSMHAVIETSKKRQGAIYTPSQWITLIKMAKVTGKPYKVKEMSQENFYSFSEMVKNQNWKTDENREQIKISKIREMCWSPEAENLILFKYTFEESSRSFNLQKGRRIQSYQLPRLYNDLLPIESKKLKGLLELCRGDEPSIPRMYHNFFFSLKAKEGTIPKKGKKTLEKEESVGDSSSQSEDEDSD